MSKPNAERRRITVDIGLQGRLILNALAAHYDKGGDWWLAGLTDGALVRRALRVLAERDLSPSAYREIMSEEKGPKDLRRGKRRQG